MTDIKVNTAKKIEVTPAAAEHIQNVLAKHPDAIGFRLGVKNAGCNNKKYMTDIVTQSTDDDVKFDANGIAIYVNRNDLLYVAGTEIDYARKGLNQVLTFNNPNATSQCGCGESFDIS